MSWLTAAIQFIYDFLADDDWELLVGLAVILPLTYLLMSGPDLSWLGILVLVGGVLLTMSISLLRKLSTAKLTP